MSRPDSCFTRRCVFALSDSAEAIQRIEEGERLGKIALADGRLMRAQVWVNFHAGIIKEDTVLERITDEIRQALREDSVWQVPRRRLMYLDFLVDQCKGNEKMAYCQQAAKTASEVKSEEDESYFNFLRYHLDYQLNPTEQLAETFRQHGLDCIKRIERKNPQYRRLKNAYYTYLMTIANIGRFDETIHIGRIMLDKYQSDSVVKQLLSPLLAAAYAETGQLAQADSCYQQWRLTDYGQRPEHQIQCVGYFCRSSVDNCRKAIEIAKTYEPSVELQLDIPNQIGFYHDLALAYKRVGNYKAAYETVTKESAVYNRMIHKNIEEEGQKWVKQLELQEKDIALARQQVFSRLAWIVAGCLFLVMIALGVTCVVYVRSARRVKAQNRKLAKQLEQIEHYRTEVSKLRVSALHRKDTKDAADAISDEELFALMEQKMDEQKLYQNPKLPFLDVCIALGVSQSRLQTFFKRSPDFHHLDNYLDMKRVAKACSLLRLKPEQSMQTICQEAGFTNTRQFNRKFKESMSMTPSEYKALSLTAAD